MYVPVTLLFTYMYINVMDHLKPPIRSKTVQMDLKLFGLFRSHPGGSKEENTVSMPLVWLASRLSSASLVP
jgi:hypothetical protein